MTRKKQTPESARRRVGQLLTSFGWDKIRRREWLNEHAQLSPQDLRKAAEAALGVDWRVWSGLQKRANPATTTNEAKEGTGEQGTE